MDNPIPSTSNPVQSPVPPAAQPVQAVPVTAQPATAPVIAPLAAPVITPMAAAPAITPAPQGEAPVKPAATMPVTAPFQAPVLKTAPVIPTVTPPAAPIAALAQAQVQTQAQISTPVAYKLGASAPVPTQSAQKPVMPAPLATLANTPIKKGIGKLLMSLIIVVFIGGGAAAFYIAAPETFYNAVGQYVGMTRPAASDVENKTNVTTTAVSEPVKPAAGTVLDIMPGADANTVAYFAKTSDLENAFEDIKTALTDKLAGDETLGIKELEEKNAELIDNISEIAFAANFDKKFLSDANGQTNPDLLQTNTPFSIGLKVTEAQSSKLLETLKTQPALKDFSIELKDNVFIFVSGVKNVLQGKLSDNPLLKDLQKDKMFSVAFSDFQKLNESVSSWPPAPNSAADRTKNIQKAIITASVLKDVDKYDLRLDISANMPDAQTAADSATKLQQQVDQLKAIIPANYQTFLVTNISQEASSLDLAITVKDLKSLATKLLDAQIEAKRVQAEKALKFGESQIGTTTELTIGTTTGTANATSTAKVPRKR